MNKKTEQSKELTVPNIVMPAVSPEEAVEAWNAYQALKQKIATKDDIQVIQGKEFFKKSYWRKIATFFNLSVEVTEEKVETVGENNVVYHFTQKAIAPNGRFAYGVGSCDQMEKGRRNSIHNTRGTAETRAFNRAVSNLVGGGEVSAEEIAVDEEKSNPSETHEAGMTDKQREFILSTAEKKGKSIKALEQTCKKDFKRGFETITMQEASQLIKKLLDLPDVKQEEINVDEVAEDIEKEQAISNWKN